MARLAPEGLEDAPMTLSPFFAAAARAVHGERDLGRAIEWVLDAARSLTGAERAAVCLIDQEGVSHWHPSSAELGRLSTRDPRDHPLLAPVIRSGAAVRLNDGGRATPDLARSLVAVPVSGADDLVCGLLACAHADPAFFDEEAEEPLAALAAHLGVAVTNHATLERLSELEESQRDMVHQLQMAVRPQVLQVADTELGAHYSAAEQGAPTGGDLWDWVLLPNGELHVAVIDIMGKGVKATKDALAVAHALRLLVLDGCPMEQLVERADQIVTQQNPDLVATLVACRYDPASGSLRLAGAGHPPALLISRGQVRQLPAGGIPIGWPGAGSFEVVHAELGRSDSLVLYTDGLIESTKDIIAGLDALEGTAGETAAFPASQQARILVERALDGADRRDDSLAVVLRRRPPPTTAPRHSLGPFSHRLSRTLASVGLARDLLRDWLVRVPVDHEAVSDLLLAASELCSNGIRHAGWDGDGVVLRASVVEADVVIEVEDDGTGLSLPYLDEEPPDPDAEQGRGLWLVHTLTDELLQVDTEQGNLVRCRKRNVVAPQPL
ncbi:MAG TPA: SpoIIE family protein phosphatase [Acidimicrobiales bacterium]|nr:SpoIIE family protein phosphatase [Acidimicrobiales bacterium]